MVRRETYQERALGQHALRETFRELCDPDDHHPDCTGRACPHADGYRDW